MIEIQGVFARLGLALVLGSLIGLERQRRHRIAGLRTNALVSLGAASFTVVSLMVPNDTSPTRVAAQVVSGIGFLGAGVILREGFNVRGLTTAATLWCAAAVGVAAGTGFYWAAIGTAGFIMATNLGLRPLAHSMRARQRKGMERSYLVLVRCRTEQETRVRALMLQSFTAASLRLRKLQSQDLEKGQEVEVRAELTSPTSSVAQLDEIIGNLSLDPDVTSLSWEPFREELGDV